VSIPAEHVFACMPSLAAPAQTYGGRVGIDNKVGRNTVTGGGPVTVTVTEPIPCYRFREGLFSVCLASGNQRRSCYHSRERASATVPPKKLRPALIDKRLAPSPCQAMLSEIDADMQQQLTTKPGNMQQEQQVSLSLRPKDLLGPVTRVKKKRRRSNRSSPPFSTALSCTGFRRAPMQVKGLKKAI